MINLFAVGTRLEEVKLLEKYSSSIVEQSLGNHQVICYGEILPALKYFCDFTGVELIKI